MTTTTETQTRFVKVTNETDEKRVGAYLYGNFSLVTRDGELFIIGVDWAGFTMDALRDRLFSGLIATEEVDARAVFL